MMMPARISWSPGINRKIKNGKIYRSLHFLLGTTKVIYRPQDRAPPARRIASYARYYVCFGPIIPVGIAREFFGAWLDIASYKQGGRARLPQALLARNKRSSERSSRCAARAALDLISAAYLSASTCQPHIFSVSTQPISEHSYSPLGLT
ncbi:hypothetical protein [Pseudomonas kurunegalensis]|uniref:hypothetical protein n=1 Tax=Pseudomonas kurunegalensis TaxID=485880 RepID=UPI003A8800C0